MDIIRRSNMPEISIKEAREIYRLNHEMKSLMLTKFPKEMLEADDSSTSDKSSHLKDVMGNELWYDADGKLIHYKAPNGYECKYDANGKLSYKKNSHGTEWWFDANGRLIHSKCSDGSER